MVRSTDGGETWHSQVTPHPYAGNGCAIAQTANDGLDHDMGYPSSVQLPDGSIFTTYYWHGEDQIRHIRSHSWRVD